MNHDLFYYSLSLFIVVVTSCVVLYHIIDSFRIEMYGSAILFMCCFVVTSSLAGYTIYLILKTI